MQKVCDVLEKLTACGVIQKYAIGGATAAGFHGEPLASRDNDVFCYLDVSDVYQKPGQHGPKGLGYWKISRKQ